MFSTKKNVLQTVALLKAYGIAHIVLSPGSRNAPLIQTFSQDPFFHCHTIVDERNAGFYALGLIQALGQTVAICCTSGSALQNYAPAVSEAFYQQLPLVIVSADRAPAWIGQMDGQTLPQANIFGTLVKKSVNLPEVKDEIDDWHCNRLINEALMACTAQTPGPVHINVPLSEPLFDYSCAQLPDVRRIQAITNDNSALSQKDLQTLQAIWAQSSRPLIIVGQSFYTPELVTLLEQLVQKTEAVVLCEHLSNCPSTQFISNFDALLQSIETQGDNAKSMSDQLTPDLVITLGGHIVSKRIKKFIRSNPPKNHWHISASGQIVDLFQSLTYAIKANSLSFLEQLFSASSPIKERPFYDVWQNASKRIPTPASDKYFSDTWAIGEFLNQLSAPCALQVANSSVLRTIQLFKLPAGVQVYGNRGVNGIEGSLPCAVGFAAVHQGLVYLLIGDLSFFYGLNALWNISHIQNLRILLINNGGGSIFHQLPGLNTSASVDQYVAAQHQTTGAQWAQAAGFECLTANHQAEFSKHLQSFVSSSIKHNLLFEICTQKDNNLHALQQYNQQLKKVYQHDNS